MWTIDLSNGDGASTQLKRTGSRVRIGRDADSDVRLNGWRVSRRQSRWPGVAPSREKAYIIREAEVIDDIPQ